ncbi:acetylhydrolase [Actinoplanes sp. NPDC051861]|uniref:alpha/beta hydrolase family protein n=1 Tax=Actinoplanes sp. NPDC051861 TaxID=3155170 RepID=UPI003413FD77
MTLTRRTLLTTALATGTTVTLGSRAGAAPAPAPITLPRPTGPHPIGAVVLDLPDGAHDRELMATVLYPARPGTGRDTLLPWLPAAPMRALMAANDFDPAIAAPVTAAHQDAPVLPARNRRPIVLYSHGNNSHRGEATILMQELASHGYIVATVDHTGDSYSQLPDGTVSLPTDDNFNPWNSAFDNRLLLDRIEAIAAGRNPDIGQRPLPEGLAAALDINTVGMAGWSKGATATAIVLQEDRRVRAGIAIDGPLQCQPPLQAVDRPLMMMTAEFSRAAEPGVEDFWQHVARGWKLNIHADGAAHPSYIDHQWLLPQLARLTGMSDEELASWIGTLDPARALRIQQAYPLAFFDLHLRGRRQRLLEGPSAAFPEVRYLP